MSVRIDVHFIQAKSLRHNQWSVSTFSATTIFLRWHLYRLVARWPRYCQQLHPCISSATGSAARRVLLDDTVSTSGTPYSTANTYSINATCLIPRVSSHRNRGTTDTAIDGDASRAYRGGACRQKHILVLHSQRLQVTSHRPMLLPQRTVITLQGIMLSCQRVALSHQ